MSDKWIQALLDSFGPDESVRFDSETWRLIREHLREVAELREDLEEERTVRRQADKAAEDYRRENVALREALEEQKNTRDEVLCMLEEILTSERAALKGKP